MIFGQFWDANQLFPFEIDFAADLLGTVGNAKKGNLEDEVVAAGLVNYFLCEGDSLFFTFHDDEGFHLIVIYHNVAPLCHAVEGDGAFHLHEF